MEPSRRNQWQPVANRLSAETARPSEIRCPRLPLVAGDPKMVRRGSTVRVRQRALQKPRKSRLFLSARLARAPVCGGYGAGYGAFSSETASGKRQNWPSRIVLRRPSAVGPSQLPTRRRPEGRSHASAHNVASTLEPDEHRASSDTETKRRPTTSTSTPGSTPSISCERARASRVSS